MLQLSMLNDLIHSALSGPKHGARTLRSAPRPLCECGHPDDGHGSADGVKPRCWNCDCGGFKGSDEG